MREMGGVWSRIAYLPAISLFFAAASLGLPGTGNFIGEFLILMGAFVQTPWISAIATSGLVFGSVYSLIMIHRAYFGPAKSDTVLNGMDARELIMVLGLAVLLIYIGVYPQPFLDTSAATMPMACSSGSAPPSLNSLRPGKSAMEFTIQHFIALAPLLITSLTIVRGDAGNRLAPQSLTNVPAVLCRSEPGPAVDHPGPQGRATGGDPADDGRQLRAACIWR